jgi:hypothetical protein
MADHACYRTMRLIHLKAHMLVLGRNPEGSHQRSVNRIDDRGLFLARPLAADFDERPGHGVPFRIGRAMLSARDRVMHPISLPSAHRVRRVSPDLIRSQASSTGDVFRAWADDREGYDGKRKPAPVLAHGSAVISTPRRGPTWLLL